MMEPHMAGRYGVISLLKDARIRKGAPVIVRADFDVALFKGGVADSSRIKAVAPTLRALQRLGARVRIIAHLGRPQGVYDAKLSLAPVGRVLARILHRSIVFVEDPFAPGMMKKYNNAEDTLLFENIRFWPGEERNSSAFARWLARWGDLYVNEAFANCHRAHASMVGVPKLMPAFAGIHLADEIAMLERVMKNPKRPLVAVFGGAKIGTKLPLIRRFLRDADYVLVGGALANTLFVAAGKSIGKSLAEQEKKDLRLLLKNKKLMLPSDIVVTRAPKSGMALGVRTVDTIGADEYIVDIGPATRKSFAAVINEAKTVVWNGPMGRAEVMVCAKGTVAIAKAIQEASGFSMVGGGDTIAALKRTRMLKGFGHVSTGGGAMLEFLSGKKLPAIEALKKSRQ